MSNITFPNSHSPSNDGFGSSHTHKRSDSLDDSSVDENGVLMSRSSHNGLSSSIAFYPPSYDPSASTSSFQMNPLSMHPPRTPRTSIMGGGNHQAHNHNNHNNMSMSMMSVGGGMGISSQFGYANSTPVAFGVGFEGGSISGGGGGGGGGGGSNVNTTHTNNSGNSRIGVGGIGIGSDELPREKEEADFEDDEVDEEELEQRVGKRVKKEQVWRDILTSSVGRDKVLKLIQYTIKVYLFLHTGLRSRWSSKQSKPFWEVNVLQRLDNTTSGLSLARKCLILFNWLTPYTTITAPQRLPFTPAGLSTLGGGKKPPKPPILHTFLHAPPPVLLDMLNGLADDVSTFSRLGLIGQRIGAKAARLADWCWFSATLVGLVEVGVEQGMVKNLMDEAEARLYAATFGPDGQPIMTGSTNNVHIKELEKELDRVRKQYFWLRISRAKLIMDLTFVSE
ncbi:hypothetical protein Clacol_001585 [Clathrus columnatus]|uniref:Uncharacterized protein n=1 Tax=Clathrus columnatus TaxID=1419009 RepID=A0AAV5A1M5_9AGAM|nr:hypothetical protein Clacol_001585 [Clathrus columnatus]